MLFKYIFIVLISTVITIECLSLNDFCVSSDIECRLNSNTNNYKKNECRKICKGKYRFRCIDGICSKKSKTCNQLNRMTLMHGSLLSIFTFLTNIKGCSIDTDDQYKLNRNDVCLNGLNCSEIQFIWLRTGLTKLEKTIDCPCRNDLYSYKCNNYCVLNNKVCNALSSSIHYYQNDDELNYKSCRNGNKVYRVASFV
jgi:hypothetical protein